MAWSTREIAELAGTSLRAVRYYHEVGLLAEPERRSNGYKQYGVAQLVRLLRIKRLVDLGFSLSQIAEMGDADAHPEEALRTLDAELAATIERLQRARVELGLILRQSAPADIPLEFTPEANVELSDADCSFLVVLSRTLGPEGREAYGDALQTLPVEPVLVEFEELSAEADEETRQDLAQRLAEYVRSLHAAHPELRDLNVDAPRGRGFAAKTAGQAVAELYNPAQADIVRRLPSLLEAAPEDR